MASLLGILKFVPIAASETVAAVIVVVGGEGDAAAAADESETAAAAAASHATIFLEPTDKCRLLARPRRSLPAISSCCIVRPFDALRKRLLGIPSRLSQINRSTLTIKFRIPRLRGPFWVSRSAHIVTLNYSIYGQLLL